MIFAAITLAFAGLAAEGGAEPRLLAHVELRSLPALERFVTGAYEDLGFAEVLAMQPRFDGLRALFPDDLGERPCAIAFVLASDRTVRVVGLAPASTADRALAAPSAHGAEVELHTFAEQAARSEGWLVRADAGDAVVRVSIDVRVAQAAWGDDVAGLVGALRTAVRFQAVRGQAAAALDDAIALLERAACGLDAWERVECSATSRLERIECEATLVPRAGGATEQWLAAWRPSPVSPTRVAFAGAELQGFIGACDADVEEVFCGGVPEALEALPGGAAEFVRHGGVFAATAAGARVALAANAGAPPTTAGAAPAAWPVVAARCLEPPAAGGAANGDCLYVRCMPAPWIARTYAQLGAPLDVAERASSGAVEVRGRVDDGALRLFASVERAALASIVPVVRRP